MASENRKVKLIRVNLNVPEDLMEKVKEFGASMGLNNTSAINVLLKKALEQNDVMEKLPQMMSLLVELQNKALELQDRGLIEK